MGDSNGKPFSLNDSSWVRQLGIQGTRDYFEHWHKTVKAIILLKDTLVNR